MEVRYPRIFGCPMIEPDEALSGWVLQVAAVAGWSAKKLLEFWYCAERDLYQLDISPRVRPYAAMSSTTLVPVASIVAAARRFGPVLSTPVYRCLTRRSDGRPVHRYCPGCLADDQRPYVRAVWRLSYWTVCERHRCLLLDRCGDCRAVLDCSRFVRVVPERGLMPGTVSCPKCGLDLRGARRVEPPESVLDPLMKTQRRLQQLVLNPVQRLSFGTVTSSAILEPLLIRENQEGDDAAAFVGLDWRRILANHFIPVEEFFSASELLDLV